MIKRNTNTIHLLLAAILFISLGSCVPKNKLAEEEQTQINDYLSRNAGLSFVKKPSGLYYLEVVPGTGLTPVVSDSAFVLYTGKFLDGQIFDENVSSGKLYEFKVGLNIAGFDEGVTLMKQGGKSTFLVPSSLGYGAYGSYPYIAGYTPLLFDVELVKVVRHIGK